MRVATPRPSEGAAQGAWGVPAWGMLRVASSALPRVLLHAATAKLSRGQCGLARQVFPLVDPSKGYTHISPGVCDACITDATGECPVCKPYLVAAAAAAGVCKLLHENFHVFVPRLPLSIGVGYVLVCIQPIWPTCVVRVQRSWLCLDTYAETPAAAMGLVLCSSG